MIDDSTLGRSRDTLKRLYILALAHPWAVVGNVCGLLALGSLSALLVVFSEEILKIFGPVLSGRVDALAPEQIAHLVERMHFYGVLFCSCAVPAGLIAGGAWYVAQYLANRSMMDLRAQFMDHFLHLDLGFHTRLAKGDMISRMSADMEQSLNMVQQLFGKVVQRPLEIVFTIGALFYVEWRLACIMFLVLVPVAAILAKVFRRTKKRATKARRRLADTLGSFEQAASGIRVIKALGTHADEVARFDHVNGRLMQAEMRTAKSRAHADAVAYGIALLLPGVAMFASIWLLDTRAITGAKIGTFLIALGRLTTMFRTTQRAWGSILQKLPAAERIFQVLDHPSAIVDAPDAEDCPPPRRAIAFEQVDFRYAPDADLVLDHLEFEIPIGSTVALVGESGAGKSTVLDLIPRFHDVCAGRVTFDGIDIRRYRHASLVRHIAIVQQDSFLFNDTIYNNIRYGRPDASRTEVESAARRAHIHEAIMALEGGAGYDTPVGDRGERLSGGQRQRVAIARALLCDAPVLILDEPTSALDADSEAHVQAALQELMRGRTAIIVAHRLATVQHADHIFVLASDAKRVVEHGTHRELLARGGEYARLVELQKLLT